MDFKKKGLPIYEGRPERKGRGFSILWERFPNLDIRD
jgi:hypothetical protein